MEETEEKIIPINPDEPINNPMLIANRLMRNIPEKDLFKALEIVTHYMSRGETPGEEEKHDG